MAKNLDTPMLKDANNGVQTIVNADGTTAKTIFTAAAEGSRVLGLSLTSDDTAIRDLALYIRKSGTDYLIGTVRIPIAAGTDGAVPSVNGLNSTDLPFLPIDNNGIPYIELATGETLKAGVLVAVTAAKTVTIVAFGKDY